MSMPSASSGFSGEEVRVVQRRTGRTLANTSSSARSASRPISGRTAPVSHFGPPTAPFSTASAAFTAARTCAGKRIAVAVDRVAAERKLLGLEREAEGRGGGVEHAERLPDGLGTDAVAGEYRDLVAHLAPRMVPCCWPRRVTGGPGWWWASGRRMGRRGLARNDEERAYDDANEPKAAGNLPAADDLLAVAQLVHNLGSGYLRRRGAARGQVRRRCTAGARPVEYAPCVSPCSTWRRRTATSSRTCSPRRSWPRSGWRRSRPCW